MLEKTELEGLLFAPRSYVHFGYALEEGELRTEFIREHRTIILSLTFR